MKPILTRFLLGIVMPTSLSMADTNLSQTTFDQILSTSNLILRALSNTGTP